MKNKNIASLKQKGFSLMSLIFIMGIGGFFGVLAMKCLPAWNEYMAVQRAISQIESSGDSNVKSAKKSFDKFAEIDRIESISSADIQFKPSGSGLIAEYEYEARVPVIDKVDIVFTFSSN